MRNLNDVREVAERCGNHWFSRGCMAFFNTRLCPSLTRKSPHDGSIWFVTSERPDDDLYGGRRYTVRRASLTYAACPWSQRNDFSSWSWTDDYGQRAPEFLTGEGWESGVFGMTFTIDTIGEFMEYPTRKAAYAGMIHAMMAAHKD